MDQTKNTPTETDFRSQSQIDIENQQMHNRWVLAAALATGLGTLWISRKIQRQPMISAMASAVATTSSVLAMANKAHLIQMPNMDTTLTR